MTQDKQIKDMIKWLQQLSKNQATIIKNQNILIKNNNAFIEKNKKQADFNRQATASINALVAKDKQHDAKDVEIETMIQGIKNMAKAIETSEAGSNAT